MRAAAVVQQLCKSCRTCFMFYCMFYFTCDRSLSRSSTSELSWAPRPTYNLVFSTSGRLRSSPVSSSSGTTQPSSSSCLRCWPPPLAGSAGLARSSIGGASSRTISESGDGFDIANGSTLHSSIAMGVCTKQQNARLSVSPYLYPYYPLSPVLTAQSCL